MDRRPNLIVLIADDHRYESIGANGNAIVQTPHLDALAARGTVCDEAHCQGSMTGAVCVPSRASLMTGRSIFAATGDPTGRRYDALVTIPDHLPTFPQRLRAAGYHTHAVGKWHNDDASFTRAFTTGDRLMFGGMSDHHRVPLRSYGPDGLAPASEIRYEDGFSTDQFRQAAQRFLEEYDRPDPFCLYVAFTAPHDPRTPPPGFTVDPESVPLPPNYLPAHPFDNGWMQGRDERLEAFPRTETAVRQHIADYYGMIAHLDAAIGDIVTTLEDTGHASDTVVVYTADHGIALGQHGLMGKQNLYEHSLHIPLIFAGSGIPAGHRLPGLVWHGDTTATLLDLAGLDADPAAAGASLLPLMRGESAPVRTTFCAAYAFGQRMARDARYKLIRYVPIRNPGHPDTATAGSATAQLFDLARDPGETTNLIHLPDMQPIVAGLDRALIAWQHDVDDPLLALAPA